ncbi:MAG: TVP38/TMEM64 family protein [Acidobacteria bacterium]|nr:MAG: TVP38/TMEM64 family protein [Acidobacteriota bacterium]
MKRTLWLIVGVAAAVIASKLLVENVLGIDLEGLVEGWMANAGAGSAAVLVALLAADLFLPVPSSLIMVLSGAAFGVVWGSVFSLVGSIGGEWLGFELVRRYGVSASRRIVGDEDLEKMRAVMARHGAAAVLVTRALPVVMETMSVVAGLSRMSRRSFLLASLAGTLPVVVVYAYAGAVSREISSIVPAVVMLVAVAGGAWVWYRARIAPSA